MSYRLQDLLRLVMPGMFLIIMSVIVYYHATGGKIVLSTEVLDLLKSSFSNIIALMVPFCGYIVGYMINAFASSVERYVYNKNILSRPSLMVLNKKKEEYIVDNESLNDYLASKGEVYTNEKANRVFQAAKEQISHSDIIEESYISSIVARNYAMSSLLLTLMVFFFAFHYWRWEQILSCAFWIVLDYGLISRWIRCNLVYAKYVLAAADFGKIDSK